MATEFLVAIASGIIVTLVSALIQRKLDEPRPIVEITRHSEWIMRRAVFEDGLMVQEEYETRIEEATFRAPVSSRIVADSKAPIVVGVLIFIAILILLLLV